MCFFVPFCNKSVAEQQEAFQQTTNGLQTGAQRRVKAQVSTHKNNSDMAYIYIAIMMHINPQ
ncbi:hypothetical protein HMPREF3214_00470 [Alloscardovia omnicolens]|nr:hypothetical protein HMPREF3214_00470 [Alloscardovia omnicolens]